MPFEEVVLVTTTNASTRAAIALTASWRFLVA